MNRYLRALLLSVLLVGITEVYCQNNVPQGIYYQAVARDDMGAEMTNESLSLQISIKENDAIIYTETHSPLTDEYGLFELTIGGGQVELGEFNTISWTSQMYFLQVELDSGTGYELISETQLLSVPFSLYAAKAGEVENTDDADADPTNEAITQFYTDGDNLIIEEGSSAFEVPLSEIGIDTDWNLISDSEMVSASGVNVGINAVSPNSTFDVKGSVAVSTEIFVSNPDLLLTEHNVDITHSIALCDVKDGDMSIGLPSATTCVGRTYTFKKYNSDPDDPTTIYSLEIIPLNNETIEKGDTWMMDAILFEEITIVSDGMNWLIISR